MMAASASRKSLDKIAALERCALFDHVPAEVLQRVAQHAVAQELSPRQVLFSQGEQARALYLVMNGELRCVRQDARGREQVLSTERAGALLAAVPALNGGKFYSTAIADSRSHVLCIEIANMRQLWFSHPQLLWNLAHIFASIVGHYAEVIETLALKNVDQRVAQFLLSLCEQAPMREGHCRELELNLTQPDMAARVGSTREVVCRALGHLQKGGFIEMPDPHHVKIPDVRALRRFAGVERALAEP